MNSSSIILFDFYSKNLLKLNDEYRTQLIEKCKDIKVSYDEQGTIIDET